MENFSRTEYEKTLAEMADILGAPLDNFIHIWAETFNLRSTGAFSSAGDCVRYICKKLNVQVNKDQIKRTGDIRYAYTLKNIKPRQGSVETIASLKSMGYKIGLISDCTSETPLVWQNTPFAPLFDVTIFSCQAGIKKPDPSIYKMALDRLGVRPEDCLYIGDGSSRELSGASQVGLHAVLIRAPDEAADAHTIEREEWHGEVISSLSEVLSLLQ